MKPVSLYIDCNFLWKDALKNFVSRVFRLKFDAKGSLMYLTMKIGFNFLRIVIFPLLFLVYYLFFCRQGQNTIKNISTCLKKKRNRILSCIQVIIMFCVIYIYLRHVKLQVVYAVTCVIYNDMQFGDGFLWNFCLFEFLN